MWNIISLMPPGLRVTEIYGKQWLWHLPIVSVPRRQRICCTYTLIISYALLSLHCHAQQCHDDFKAAVCKSTV